MRSVVQTLVPGILTWRVMVGTGPRFWGMTGAGGFGASFDGVAGFALGIAEVAGCGGGFVRSAGGWEFREFWD